MAKTEKKGFGLHLTIAIIAGAFALLGLVLFLLGFTTNYYTFGGMNSILITVFIVLAIIAIAASAAVINKYPDKIWAKLMPFAAIGLLAAASMLIVGDRVEGIGNCIITDYDSGHGGEQAIYMSLVGAVSLLVSIIYLIIGLFHKDITQPAPRAKTLGFSIAGGVVAVAAIVATLGLVGVNLTSGTSVGPGGVSTGEMASGTYTVSFNGNNGNVDSVRDYEFIPATVKGLLNADSRLFLDLTLTLDGAGNYKLFADSYCVEGGKRAEIGDDTGLGLILTTTAEGTYVDNGDGTVTTSPATHAVSEMATDTYSTQMKSPAKMKVGDHEEDGTYDSNDYPEVLDLVPETVWTIADGKILSYGRSALKGEFKVTLNKDYGNAEMGDTQFLTAGMKGLMNADNRFYVDITLSLDGAGSYKLISDAYVIDSGKRAEIGDPSGLALVYRVTGEGSYTDNGDGTVTTEPATHATLELETDTYSDQMKQMMKLGDYGISENGSYDSAEKPELLNCIPETVWTLSGTEIVDYAPVVEEEPAEEQPSEDTPATPAAESVTIASDDGGTAITFNPDGTFAFDFDAYSVHEEGTYVYEGGVLTVTNPNGDSFTAEGDPMALHYVTAVSEQLAGDYTIPAAAFDFAQVSEGGFDAFTVDSDDGGTKLTVNPDGTYVFAFESYGIEDPGTWSTVDGKTVFVNANGLEMPLENGHLHYVSGVSEQLTGDFTFEMPAAGAAEASGFDAFTVDSDDGGTKLTVNPDGTYVFAFESYGIEDPGTWSTVDGKTVFVNANGLEMPLEDGKLHYISGVSDQLTGDFTFEMPASGGASAEPYIVPSDDGATTITFNGDGTYMFEFASYGVQDAGTYAFDGATLTVVNSTGLEMTTADGKLHYVSGVSEQLTGDFTLDLSKL